MNNISNKIKIIILLSIFYSLQSEILFYSSIERNYYVSKNRFGIETKHQFLKGCNKHISLNNRANLSLYNEYFKKIQIRDEQLYLHNNLKLSLLNNLFSNSINSSVNYIKTISGHNKEYYSNDSLKFSVSILNSFPEKKYCKSLIPKYYKNLLNYYRFTLLRNISNTNPYLTINYGYPLSKSLLISSKTILFRERSNYLAEDCDILLQLISSYRFFKINFLTSALYGYDTLNNATYIQLQQLFYKKLKRLSLQLDSSIDIKDYRTNNIRGKIKLSVGLL
jgi:hypothetical protein